MATPTIENEGWTLPTDAFVEILLCLTPIKRWRLRLVCRHWRDVIHDRTPAPLAFVVNYCCYRKISASVYTIDEKARSTAVELCQIAAHGLVDKTRPGLETDRAFDTMMVGTCNGILCLCDNTKPGGAITLLNPVTRETLPVPVPPVPPGSDQWSRRTLRPTSSGWHEAYSFGYDPMTERYKIVHLPCNFDHTHASFDAVQVFTLGEETSSSSSWRNVAVPGASCCLDAGIDGAMYWVTNDATSVVSFDLKDERVRFRKALPVRAEQGYRWQLTEVHGRLGIVSCRVDNKRAPGPEKNEVRSVKINEQTRGTAVSGLRGGGCISGMFTYVKTKERLSAYCKLRNPKPAM
ncbi:hypothetical protein QOZ80_8BG0664480 [Eleusine coracana subsp. coracana]|nr:hypothetical protein QOZ80_8BG0664480 [Eleusine coracana subsp. coracana]